MSIDFSAIDPAVFVAATAAPAPQQANPLITLLMFGGLFVFMYLLIIRPQRKRQKDHQNLVSALSKGDEVVMTSGLLGKITKVDDDYITVQAANNVELKYQRTAVHAVLPKGTIKAV
jgi:preprotein translocase subunit YajC